MLLIILHRRHFEPLAVASLTSTPAERALVREELHTAVSGAARLCAQIDTELVLQPGRCDSMSLNRKDCSDRSYVPQDGNVEVIF